MKARSIAHRMPALTVMVAATFAFSQAYGQPPQTHALPAIATVATTSDALLGAIDASALGLPSMAEQTLAEVRATHRKRFLGYRQTADGSDPIPVFAFDGPWPGTSYIVEMDPIAPQRMRGWGPVRLTD